MKNLTVLYVPLNEYETTNKAGRPVITAISELNVLGVIKLSDFRRASYDVFKNYKVYLKKVMFLKFSRFKTIIPEKLECVKFC